METNQSKTKKDNRGGPRAGSGRPKGSRERATKAQKATIAELARVYTEDAINTLVDVMKNGETDSARVAAVNSLLDRGYGKAPANVDITSQGDKVRSVDVGRLSVEALRELVALGDDSGDNND